MGLFSDQFEPFMASLQRSVDTELEDVVLPEAQRRVPVRTGKLKASLSVGTERRGTEIVGVIEAGKPYAPYVELGAKDRAAKPFLRPSAATFSLDRVTARMKDGDQ